MRQFCELRSESISMQLANGETTTNMSYVDASGLTASDMGSMGGKGGFGGMPDRESGKGNFGNRGSSDGNTSTKLDTDASPSDDMNIQETSASATDGTTQNGGMPTMPEGFDPSQIQGGFSGQMPNMGEIPEGFDPSQMPEGFNPSGMQGGFGGMFPNGASDGTGTTSSDNSDNSNRPSRDNMQMPGGNWGSGMNGMGNTAGGSTNLIWLVMSVLILGIGLLIANKYKY